MRCIYCKEIIRVTEPYSVIRLGSKNFFHIKCLSDYIKKINYKDEVVEEEDFKNAGSDSS
ncbi:hypothetical protein [Persephonella sp.]